MSARPLIKKSGGRGKAVKALQELIDIQCSDGNWNYDPYMQGMANGLICAMSVLTGKEPNYMSAPKKWLCKRKVTRHFIAVEIPEVVSVPREKRVGRKA